MGGGPSRLLDRPILRRGRSVAPRAITVEAGRPEVAARSSLTDRDDMVGRRCDDRAAWQAELAALPDESGTLAAIGRIVSSVPRRGSARPVPLALAAGAAGVLGGDATGNAGASRHPLHEAVHLPGHDAASGSSMPVQKADGG